MAVGGVAWSDWLAPSDRSQAPEAVRHLLNCRWDEASAVLAELRPSNPSAASAHAIVQLMRYLCSFEETHKGAINESIKWAEKEAPKTDALRHHEKESLEGVGLEVYVEVLRADLEICQAFVHFITLEWSGYVRGGWHLRKAWKLFDKAYRKAKQTYDAHAEGCTNKECQKSKSSLKQDHSPMAVKRLLNNSDIDSVVVFQDKDVHGANGVRVSKGNTTVSECEILHHLLANAAFGFGLFHLCISILSPMVLKFVHFLGFRSDRDIGLACLKFVVRSRHSLKAPLAALALLWFHTVARPFFALDANSVNAGVEEAETILRRQPNNEDTVLFLFFRGRCQRLGREIQGALDIYEKALTLAGEQRELRLMCIYEIGWCHLLLLHWREAVCCFAEMRTESRWAPAYYSYILGLCSAVLDDLISARSHFRDSMASVKRKNNPVESFVSKRAKFLESDEELCSEKAFLYLMELMYIWRALPSAAQATLVEYKRKLIPDSNEILFLLVRGAIELELGDGEAAERSLSSAAEMERGVPKEDKHLSAFAAYEFGRLLVSRPGSVERGRRWLEIAKTRHKGYHFENRLSVRIHAALMGLSTNANSSS